MGDRPWAGKPSRYVTSHPGQLSLAISPWVGAMSSSLYGLRGEGLVWLIGAVVCLHPAPRVQLFARADNGWPHNALRGSLHLPSGGDRGSQQQRNKCGQQQFVVDCSNSPFAKTASLKFLFH